MNKPLFSALYILSLLTAGLTIRQAFAQRGPAVEAVTEVSIEDSRPILKKGQTAHGFNFANGNAVNSATLPEKKIPANITKSGKNTSYSYIGPVIFLLALPLALWIVISKKIKTSGTVATVESSSIKRNDENKENKDHNLPKAS